jgi:hypothetical protein
MAGGGHFTGLISDSKTGQAQFVNGTPTPDGMLSRVQDSISVKSSGPGKSVTWQQQTIEKFSASIEKVQKAYSDTLPDIQKSNVGSSDAKLKTGLIESCERALNAASESTRATAELSAIERDSATGVSPNEKLAREMIQRLLTAWDALRSAASDYQSAARQIAEELERAK